MTAERKLPAGMAPRLLSSEQASAYVGLSSESFLREVLAGTFPQPIPLKKTKRRLWDKAELDRVLDSRLTVEVEGDWDELEKKWRQGRQKDARRRNGQGIPV